MKNLTLFMGLLLTTAITQNAFSEPKIKPETINIEGRLGTISVQRVKSIQSEIRYVPNEPDAIGYTIINPANKGTDLHDEHLDSGELSIPSWTLFNW